MKICQEKVGCITELPWRHHEEYMSMVLTKNIDEFGEDDGDAVHALGSR